MESNYASRIAAIRVITRWLQAGTFPDRAIPDSPDRGFIMDLVYGTVRQRRTLEWLLSQQVSRMPQGETLAALLVGTFQLFYMTNIPDYAAVGATVAAAKRISGRSTGFVNGVLRNLARQRETLTTTLASQPAAVRLSHPDILYNRWLHAFGTETTDALCAWNNRPAETVIALLPHCGITTAEWIKRALAIGDDIKFEPHPAAPDTSITLPHGAPPLTTLPGYEQGWFIVQDPATNAAIDLLAPQPGDRILDACAAPGGKTIQIASRLMAAAPGSDTPAELLALDFHKERLEFLRENLERIGMNWVKIEHNNAATFNSDKPFNRILLDLPCSNTGVLRRRPDARWRFPRHRLDNLLHQQRAILNQAVKLLAPGGRIVYSTCSIENDENMAQIERCLTLHPQLRLENTTTHHPVHNQTDGAFAAALILN